MNKVFRLVALCALAAALAALVVGCKGEQSPAGDSSSSATNSANPTGSATSPPSGGGSAAPPASTTPPAPGAAGSSPGNGQLGASPVPPSAPAIPLVPSGPPAQVVAKVNGRTITRAELDFAIKNVVKTEVPPEQHARVRHDVLNSLIDQELVYQKALASKLDVTPAELSASMAKVKSDFPDEKVFAAELAKDGMTPASVESMVHHAMVIDKYFKTTVVGQVKVTPEDESKFYQENLQYMKHPEQVRASHILLRVSPGTSPEQKASQKAKAEEALTKARSGSDFGSLAKEYSQDPGSSQNGGDLGFFAKGRMIPAFDQAAFALKVGAISDVVETNFGYHIIKVTDRRAEGVSPIADVRSGIHDQLMKQKIQGEVQRLTEALRKQAKIETSL